MADGALRREFNSILNLLLLPTVLWVIATGVIAELWDINDFVYHKYPAFALAVLVSTHIFLKLPQWWAGTRTLFTIEPHHIAETQPHAAVPRPRGGLTRRDALSLVVGAMGGFFTGRFLTSTRELPLGDDIGDIYHRWSQPGYVSLLRTALNWGTQPPPFKDYPNAEKIALPKVSRRDAEGRSIERPGSLEEAIARRRSVRDYADGALSLEELARLLYYSSGINDTRWGIGLRAAPSAGAQYPIETYAVVQAVVALPQGIYHYNVRDHLLERVRSGDFRQAIMDYGLAQEFLGKANVVLALTAIFQRTRWRYQERAYRYVMLEAGHIAQNLYLMGTALGLGVCAVGAFWDDEINRLLEVDGKEEAALYLLAVGRM